jgi:hypothetical protein
MEVNHPTLLKRQPHQTSMRSVAVLAVVALLAVTLAGCSEDPERYPNGVPTPGSSSRSHSGSATQTSSASGTSTGPAGNATNQPPTGSLAAAANGTAATFKANGTDPDGDALNWTLAFGDGNSTNGTTLPATLAHNYTLPANVTSMNVTARLTLSDGVHNVTYNATLSIGAAGGASQAFAGSWKTGAAGCAAPIDPWAFGTPANGVDVLEFDVDPATIGGPFTAAFTPGGPNLFWGLSFFDGASPNSNNVGDFPDLDGANTVSGAVPAGAAHGLFYSCGTGGSVTYQAG